MRDNRVQNQTFPARVTHLVHPGKKLFQLAGVEDVALRLLLVVLRGTGVHGGPEETGGWGGDAVCSGFQARGIRK